MTTSTCTVGPESGRVTVHTGRGGLGGKLGHDLVLEVTAWSGTVTVDSDHPETSRVDVTVDARSLEVREATGGVKPLTASDRAEIRRNIEKVLPPPPSITFHSTNVVVTGGKVSIEGELTIGTTTRPIRLDGTVANATRRVSVQTAVVQTAFGIKPYSAMMGALRVRDEVEVRAVVTLPVDGAGGPGGSPAR